MDSPNSPEDKAYYERAWAKLAQGLLLWSDERATAWASKRIEALGDNPFLSHEHASWYVVPELVPETLRRAVGHRVGIVHARLSEVNLADLDQLVERPLDHAGWAEARERIRSVLAGFESAAS